MTSNNLDKAIRKLAASARGSFRIEVESYPDGWIVCMETYEAGLHQYKSVIVKREEK